MPKEVLERRYAMSIIVGLTGGIASGKSTISKMFKEKEVPVIDTDGIARNLLDNDESIYNAIVETFGEAVLTTDKKINRNKVAQIIFSDADKRQALNDIVHPKVKDIALREVSHYKEDDHKIIVVDVPLLFEASFDKVCDVTVVVYARKKDQVSRLVSREGIDEAYAKQKVNAQMPMAKKKSLADYVIDNSKSILETKKSFERVFEAINSIEK